VSNYVRGMNEDFGENTESKSERKIEQSLCPKCGSDDLNYGDSELQDDYIYYEGDCNKCKTQFWEWYKLEFSGFDIVGEDLGDEVEYLNVGDVIINDRKSD
jgi:hypothetical protein